jgi:hypothetical protein
MHYERIKYYRPEFFIEMNEQTTKKYRCKYNFCPFV